MTLPMIGIIGLCVLFVLIFSYMPVGLSMAMVGFIGMGIIRGIEPGLSLLGMEYFRTVSSYPFSVIPLFVAMGFIASEVGLSTDGFYTINKWLGHVRGGLAMATTATCGVFAAICGDAIATATSVAAVALPQMRKHRYADVLSCGCLAAGGNLGFIIPPSLGFIIYGILTEQSIGTLFISGILPGILLAFLFIVTIGIVCRINPQLAPLGPKASWKEKLGSLRYIVGSFILIAVVLGGIYGGIVTPTEAGGIGVFGALVIGLINRRLNRQTLTSALRETATLTGRIFILVGGAIVFSRFMVVSELPLYLAEYLRNLSVSPYVILGLVLIFYILIGFIMDIMSVIMIMAPILHPILVALEFDPVWIAVITMLTVLMGHISPPVGIVVYGLSAYVTDVPVMTIFKGALPFLGAMLVCLIILIFFPQIALFLPHLMIPG